MNPISQECLEGRLHIEMWLKHPRRLDLEVKGHSDHCDLTSLCNVGILRYKLLALTQTHQNMAEYQEVFKNVFISKPLRTEMCSLMTLDE